MNDVIQSQPRKGNTSAQSFDRTWARHQCFFLMPTKLGTYKGTKSFSSNIDSGIVLPYPLCNAPLQCSIKPAAGRHLRVPGHLKNTLELSVQKSRRVDEAPSTNDGDLSREY